MKKVNFCGKRFQEITGNWTVAYNLTIEAFKYLNYKVCISPHLNITPSIHPTEEIVDSSKDIYLYNHTYTEELYTSQSYFGEKTLFLKPTAPTPDYFSLDTIGYGANSSITYTKPPFESILNENYFYDTKVKEFKNTFANKWSNVSHLQFSKDEVNVPENHILILGQMTGDSTVSQFSFGDHWKKLTSIVNSLKNDFELVIKLHPTLEERSKKIPVLWDRYEKDIQSWKSQGILVLKGYESLHKILPHTRVAITENSTSGIECLMYDIPIISYGYPEYHWITKDLRHLTQLRGALLDLSWYSKILSRKWFTWYCTQYLCYDLKSTISQLEKLLTTS